MLRNEREIRPTRTERTAQNSSKRNRDKHKSTSGGFEKNTAHTTTEKANSHPDKHGKGTDQVSHNETPMDESIKGRARDRPASRGD